jgi:hypothetical protein
MKKAVAAALEAGTPIFSGGSRRLRGNCAEHESLEAEAARFFGAETTVFFGGGYVANFAVLTTLPQRGDLLVLDSLVHASIHEGARAGRAEFCQAVHNDPQSFETEIRDWRARGGTGRIWIVVESLYSMDGDFAPLEELVAIADRYEAFLLVDEAHATGVYGEQGRGLTARYEGRDNLIVVHTCGKALGAAGALVTMPRVLRDFMVNRCRPFIFATAPSPLMAVAVQEALLILQQEPAHLDGVAIDTKSLRVPDVGQGPLVIEGAGGLMVPLDRETLYIDLFAQWQLPVCFARARRSAPSTIRSCRSKPCDRARSTYSGSRSSAPKMPIPKQRFAEWRRCASLDDCPGFRPSMRQRSDLFLNAASAVVTSIDDAQRTDLASVYATRPSGRDDEDRPRRRSISLHRGRPPYH